MDYRKIDALIAEHVMELEYIPCNGNGPRCWYDFKGDKSYIRDPPHYSTDIAAAWEVVEKMENYEFSVRSNPHLKKFRWSCSVWRVRGLLLACEESKDSAPTAICLAALKAKGIKHEL